MSMFQCPACGKYISYARYDPSGFDDDILGIDVHSHGRGSGFDFSSKFSLLGDEHLCSLITKRCRRILWFTEGEEPPKPGAMANLRKINQEWAAYGAEAENTLKQQDKKIHSLREELDRSGPSVFAAQVEDIERKNRQLQVAYGKLESKYNLVVEEKQELGASNRRLKDQLETYKEYDEDEPSAKAQMESLLRRINKSSNTHYTSLSDAIDWLLEY